MGIIRDFEKLIKEAGETREFYTGIIYCYTNLINGKKYIGKTINEIERKYCHKKCSKNPKQYFHKAVKKYGWDNFRYNVIYRRNYISRKDANFDLDLMEILSISEYNTTNHLIGYNIGFGGGGSNGNKGKEVSEETRLKISSANKSVIHDKQWIEKVAEKHKKSVLQYSLNGEYIKTFDCLTSASIEAGNTEKVSAISAVCKGKRKSAYGYIWKYEGDNNKIITPYKHLKPKRRIGKFDLSDNLIAEYDSMTDAAKNTTYYVANISKCCRGEVKSAYGFIWKFLE